MATNGELNPFLADQSFLISDDDLSFIFSSFYPTEYAPVGFSELNDSLALLPPEPNNLAEDTEESPVQLTSSRGRSPADSVNIRKRKACKYCAIRKKGVWFIITMQFLFRMLTFKV
jgi:hypothetical protein